MGPGPFGFQATRGQIMKRLTRRPPPDHSPLTSTWRHAVVTNEPNGVSLGGALVPGSGLGYMEMSNSTAYGFVFADGTPPGVAGNWFTLMRTRPRSLTSTRRPPNAHKLTERCEARPNEDVMTAAEMLFGK
jgi:hypothetical protein